jgi:hypothetical protein
MVSEVPESVNDIRNMKSEVTASVFDPRNMKSGGSDGVPDIHGMKSEASESAPGISRAWRGVYPDGSAGRATEQWPRATDFRGTAGTAKRRDAMHRVPTTIFFLFSFHNFSPRVVSNLFPFFRLWSWFPQWMDCDDMQCIRR